MATLNTSPARPKPLVPPVLTGRYTPGSITDKIGRVIFNKTPLW